MKLPITNGADLIGRETAETAGTTGAAAGTAGTAGTAGGAGIGRVAGTAETTGAAETAMAGVVRRFTEHFGHAPAGVWRAPGRMNLIGEHTDYNEGFALPFAIGAGVCVAAAPRSDGLVAMTSGQCPGEDLTVPADALAPGFVQGWAAYPAGVVWALRAAGLDTGGVSLAVDADLAPGSGLSSSAALECAVALAVTELRGLTVPRHDLAILARRAENDFVGAPTGMMDQMAALLSEPGHALLLDCRSGSATPVRFDPVAAGLALLVIDTRARHQHVSGGYAARRLACERAARDLGVPALRDVTSTGALEGLADPTRRRRARHVVTDNARVLSAVELLGSGRLADVGPLLTASHASLRDDFEISWPEADLAVAAATRAGALGARMVGGGFGGSVLALVAARSADVVAGEVGRQFAGQDWPAPVVFAVVPSAGGQRLA